MRPIAFATLSCLALASCSGGVLDPEGPVGLSERTILFDATVIMLAVIVPVILLTLAFAWWFRAGNKRAIHLPDWEYSGRLEVIVWSIPALIIMFLGGVAWIGSNDLDPPRPIASATPPIEVEVVSLDWKWLFIYPERGIASVNRLVVPVGAPIRFRLTSASVMNVFFVPRLGSMIYTMAGMTTRLNLEADHAGHYDGLSANFSGDGFADMHFKVDAVSAAEFEAWIVDAKALGTTLDAQSYDGLAKPSRNVAPYEFAAVASGLFDAISMGQTPHQEN